MAELILLEECGSTNDEAHRRAEQGAPHLTAVMAEVQTNGRGRRGRTWVSPRGTNLAVSLVLRPQLPPQRAPELALVGAVAVCETAREHGAARAAIKWPNDIECGGRKLSGLLAELRADPRGLSHVVLGIGLNVNSELPPELNATSLRQESGAEQDRAQVLATLLERVAHWTAVHENDGFEPVRARWRALASTLGRRVRIEGPTPLEGEAVDLAEDGALVVRTPQGLTRVVAGDVEHCRVS